MVAMVHLTGSDRRQSTAHTERHRRVSSCRLGLDSMVRRSPPYYAAAIPDVSSLRLRRAPHRLPSAALCGTMEARSGRAHWEGEASFTAHQTGSGEHNHPHKRRIKQKERRIWIDTALALCWDRREASNGGRAQREENSTRREVHGRE